MQIDPRPAPVRGASLSHSGGDTQSSFYSFDRFYLEVKELNCCGCSSERPVGDSESVELFGGESAPAHSAARLQRPQQGTSIHLEEQHK